MRLIDSDALGFVTKALGLTGRGSQVTELTDGVVDQALDVVPLIRRGRTLAKSEGVFVWQLRNEHGGATSLSTTVNPFAITVGNIAPFPSPIPDTLDLWLLTATVVFATGAPAFEAALFINYPARVMGLAVDDGNVAIAPGVTSHPIVFWDAIIAESINFGLRNGARGPLAKIGIRLPRDITTQIVFASTTDGISNVDCNMTVGLFPASLGQDGIV